MPELVKLAFVSSAYNEAENLEELHRRCRDAHTVLQQEFAGKISLGFRFVVADNGSSDRSVAVLENISRLDGSVVALVNKANYGPEPSVANALAQALDCDLFVALCSDLQDPPELAVKMVANLLARPDLDAVLAVKSRSSGNPLMRMARRSYYKVLSYSSRLQNVPVGFHGFGCYRREVVDEALRYWEHTDLNLRQCLINASQSADRIAYQQPDREHGSSSYRGWGYWPEAMRSLVSADAAASRVALLIGGGGLVLVVVVGMLLLANFLRGISGYSGGNPTVMGLVLLSFVVQMLMFTLLSRQIELLRMRGFRPKVHFRVLDQGSRM